MPGLSAPSKKHTFKLAPTSYILNHSPVAGIIFTMLVNSDMSEKFTLFHTLELLTKSNLHPFQFRILGRCSNTEDALWYMSMIFLISDKINL